MVLELKGIEWSHFRMQMIMFVAIITFVINLKFFDLYIKLCITLVYPLLNYFIN